MTSERPWARGPYFARWCESYNKNIAMLKKLTVDLQA